jgi:hypothetical protein
VLEGIAAFRWLLRQRRADSKLVAVRERVKRGLEKTWRILQDRVGGTLDIAGAHGLRQAVEAGLVELRPVEMAPADPRFIEVFIDYVRDALSSHATYPLLDDRVSALVETGIQTGNLSVSDSDARRAREVKFAAHLFDRLPLFESATVAEIMHIRRELERPLVRFRSAVTAISAAIETAAWDKDFPHDADAAVRVQIEPALLDIEDAIRSNRFIEELAGRIVTAPLALPAGSMLGLAMSAYTDMPAVVAQTLGVSVMAAAATTEAFRKYRAKALEIERNNLYFYYRARQKLTE